MPTVIPLAGNTESALRQARAAHDGGGLVVDWITPRRNSAVRLAHGPKRGRTVATGWAADVLAAAAAIYVADMHMARSATPDGWTRDIQLTLPLAQSSGLRGALSCSAEALSFVSGDRIEVDASESRRQFAFEVDPLAPGGVDAVCLFSGGVDSLLGAIQLLDQGLRVCLVSHYADGVTSASHDGLRTRLGELFPDQVDYRPYYVSRGGSRRKSLYALPEKVERSHRVRSFLFLAAGAFYADLYDVDTIFVPENGLIALNVPLDATRTGAHSTRTAHPHFLALMTEALSSTKGSPLRICNPFGLRSKTEMVASAPPWTRELLLDSLSCAKYDSLRWLGSRPERHCGCCLPCIYRRLAFDSAGLDTPEHYAFDAFRVLPDLSHTRNQDLRSLAFFARRYSRADAATRRGLMFAGGPLPSSAELSSLFGMDQDVGSLDFMAMYDRFVSDAIPRLQRVCSSQTRAILGL